MFCRVLACSGVRRPRTARPLRGVLPVQGPSLLSGLSCRNIPIQPCVSEHPHSTSRGLDDIGKTKLVSLDRCNDGGSPASYRGCCCPRSSVMYNTGTLWKEPLVGSGIAKENVFLAIALEVFGTCLEPRFAQPPSKIPLWLEFCNASTAKDTIYSGVLHCMLPHPI